MSLIDDALKRADAASPGSTGRASAWTPTHLPERRTSSKRFGAPLVIGLIVLAGAAWVLAHRQQPVRRPVSQVPLAAPRAEAPANVPAAESGRIEGPDVIVPPPMMPPAAARSHAPAEHGAARPSQDESKILSENSPAPESHPAAPPPAAAPHSPKALANGKTFTGEVSLPSGAKIELDGIVYSESSPVALLNGHVVAPGGSIEGMTLSKVEPDRIELQGQGFTVFLLLK